MGDLVMVYRGGGGPLRASVIASALEAAGIEAAVQSNVMTAIYPVNVGGLGEFTIWVQAEDEQRALEILESDDSGTENS